MQDLWVLILKQKMKHKKLQENMDCWIVNPLRKESLRQRVYPWQL